MNKKAQMGLGVFLMVFIAVIVGLALFLTIAQTTGSATATSTATNVTYTAPANGARIDLTGQDLLSTPVVHNATTGTVILAGNYTIDEIVSTSTGVKTISLQVDSTDQQSLDWNVSYTYGADGYVNSSGARAMVSLIAIFFALAVVVITIGPVVKEGLSNLGN